MYAALIKKVINDVPTQIKRNHLNLNLKYFMLLACLGLQGCTHLAPVNQELTKRDRELCMGRASDQSVSADESREKLAACLKDASNGRLKLEQSDIIPATPARESPLNKTDQYKYCVLHRDEVSRYFDLYTGASAKLAVLTRDLGSNDQQTMGVNERLSEAERELQRLLPQQVIGDMPLVPDAATKFSTCNRSDFIQ